MSETMNMMRMILATQALHVVSQRPLHHDRLRCVLKIRVTLQCTGSKDRTDSNLPTYIHLQAPDHIQGDTQHCNIRNCIENSACQIQYLDF